MRLFWFTLLATLALVLPAAAQAEEDFNKLMQKAVEQLQAGKYEEGVATLKHCLELQPNDSIAAYNLACAYSLQKQTDAACEWFDKGVKWGFGFAQMQNMTFPDTDKDLDNIRTDPRYAKGMEQMKAMAKTCEEFYSKPVVYIPEAIKSAEAMPLLVVLHDSGQTAAGAFEKGPWKALADELGTALLMPSAKIPVKLLPELSPKDGMTWFSSAVDYQGNYWKYEKTISESVSAFKKEHKLDPARVFIAGDGQGGMVAINVALFSPGQYKGSLSLAGMPFLQLGQPKLATAAKMGQKMTLLIDNKKVFGAGDDPARIAEIATQLEGAFKKLGFPAKIERFDRKPDDPEQMHAMLKAALEGLAVPATPVEAGTGK